MEENSPKRLEIKTREEVENIICEDIKEEEVEEMLKVAQAMIEFIAKEGALGLSAPQLGINKKLIIWRGIEGVIHVGFNPTFFPKDKKTTNTIEGCLSYPNEEYFLEKRKKYIQAIYYAPNQQNKLLKVKRSMTNQEAIIYQHEVSHLMGETIATMGKKL